MIERVVVALVRPAGFDRIGVSPGGNASDSIVDRAPFLGWRDVDLRSLLVDRLGIATTVENDVVALPSIALVTAVVVVWEAVGLVRAGRPSSTPRSRSTPTAAR